MLRQEARMRRCNARAENSLPLAGGDLFETGSPKVPALSPALYQERCEMYYESEYQPSEDGPEARMHRDAATWERFCANRVEILLAELSPFDSTRTLFSFAEIRRWHLKRRSSR